MGNFAVKLAHPPTIADIDALPSHMKGEIIDGVFYAMTRPRGAHQSVAGRVYSDVHLPYDRKRGGPGGWWILPEPGIELVNSPEVAPDVAGWTRERMPTVSSKKSIKVVPDWVCEVLSSSTRRYDQQTKKPFYARVGVGWMWVVDPAAQLVIAHHNEDGRWIEVGVWSEERDARIAPFDAVEIDVTEWWVPTDEE